MIGFPTLQHFVEDVIRFKPPKPGLSQVSLLFCIRAVIQRRDQNHVFVFVNLDCSSVHDSFYNYCKKLNGLLLFLCICLSDCITVLSAYSSIQ